MSDTQAQQTLQPLDKGKRLASVMSMGHGYFKAKLALEEHDWNVDEAAASLLAKDGKPVAKDESTDERDQVMAPSSSGAASPDPIGTQFLKEDTPDTSSLNPHGRATATSSPVAALKDDESHLSPVSVADHQSLTREASASKTQDNEDENDDLFPYLPHYDDMNMKYEAARAPRPFPRASLEETDRQRSVPGAFREGRGNDDEDMDTATALDSALDSLSYSQSALDSLSYSQTTTSDKPYMAIAEVVTLPELVNATLQEPTRTADTSTQGLAVSMGSSEDKSTVQETGWMRRRRRLYMLLMVALLVLIGLVVGLVVTQRPDSSSVGRAAGVETPTASPTMDPSAPALKPTVPSPDLSSPSPTLPPEPSTSRPTQLPTGTQTVSPTLPPTSLSTPQPTTQPTTPFPTTSPVTPPTELPTSPPTILSTTPPPTILSTTPPPTALSTTPLPTTISTTPLPTVLPSGSVQESRVDNVQMVLSGVSLLDGNTLSMWAKVTAGFILAETKRAIQELSENSSYKVHLNIAIESQTMDANDRLEINSSFDFSITSSVSSHDVESYVLGAFDSDTKRSAYIAELKATGNSSFDNVSDVAVSL